MKLGDFKAVGGGTEDFTLLLARFNATQRPYPRDETVHALFARQAARQPDAVAIVGGDREYSYRELDEASTRFARFLIDQGVRREDPVALLLQRPFETVAAMLGALKAGCAYVPLEPSTPFARARQLLDNMNSGVLVTERRYLQLGKRLQLSCPGLGLLFCADSRDVLADLKERAREPQEEHEIPVGVGGADRGDDRASPQPPRGTMQYDLKALADYAPDPIAPQSGPTGLAYVMYTSGTSGQPKGVMIEHRAIVRLVMNTDYVQLGSEDRVLQTGSLAFDASTFEIWGPLLNGGGVCLPPERSILDSAEVTRLIAKHRITAMFITTSLFNHYVDSDINMFAGLKFLLTGGEKASPQHFNKLVQRYPRLKFVHVYGPTENTTFTTSFAVERSYSGDLPIGRPIANTEVLILDGSGLPAPIGVPGEICAAGDGLARGYLHDPDLTQQKFTPHPFKPGQRIYRTGDSGLWRADGAIEFRGRLDSQIKIRGHRIEPMEIEHHVLRYPGVRQAVVVARDVSGGKELAAYVTTKGDLGAACAQELRLHLSRLLPDYMVPPHIIWLKKMPLNPNGKIDRALLPAPIVHDVPQAPEFEPPANETERAMVAIWEEVLGRSPVGVTDNFFDRGGHSLRIAKSISLIERRLGVTVPLAEFFTYPTVRALAAYIIDRSKFGVASADHALVPLSANGDGPSLFAFPPGTGDALGFAQLAALLPCRFYGFNFIEADTRLSDYADLIIGTDPDGPYLLLGYSSGGNLAYHVARELEQRGRRVAGIVMVDSTRRLHPTPMPDQEVERVTREFLNDESMKPYLASPILRDKAQRLVGSSLRYAANSVDYHTIDTDIHVLTSENPAAEYRDASGKLVVSQSAWTDVIRGELKVYRGDGSHNTMLGHPHVARNAAAIADILTWMRRGDAMRRRTDAEHQAPTVA